MQISDSHATTIIIAGNKSKTDLDLEQREEWIRDMAYYLWKKKGEKHGEDREDWLAAEASFNEDYSD
ncbi:MAG: DUF2934 domain-containing protein [Chlorobiales bacterium]|nr:DUF2934 domain-containing protein [Chlorobiales bacterium]